MLASCSTHSELFSTSNVLIPLRFGTCEPGGLKVALGTILLVVLVLLLVGALPAWPHSQSWGYVPSGGLGLVLVIVVVLLLLGRI